MLCLSGNLQGRWTQPQCFIDIRNQPFEGCSASNGDLVCRCKLTPNFLAQGHVRPRMCSEVKGQAAQSDSGCLAAGADNERGVGVDLGVGHRGAIVSFAHHVCHEI
jgi:hypothetical protein